MSSNRTAVLTHEISRDRPGLRRRRWLCQFVFLAGSVYINLPLGPDVGSCLARRFRHKEHLMPMVWFPLRLGSKNILGEAPNFPFPRKMFQVFPLKRCDAAEVV